MITCSTSLHFILLAVGGVSLIAGGVYCIPYYKWRSISWTECTTVKIWSTDELCSDDNNLESRNWLSPKVFRNTAYAQFSFPLSTGTENWGLKVGCGDNKKDAIERATKLYPYNHLCPCGWNSFFGLYLYPKSQIPERPGPTILCISFGIVGAIGLFYIIYLIWKCVTNGESSSRWDYPVIYV